MDRTIQVAPTELPNRCDTPRGKRAAMILLLVGAVPTSIVLPQSAKADPPPPVEGQATTSSQDALDRATQELNQTLASLKVLDVSDAELNDSDKRLIQESQQLTQRENRVRNDALTLDQKGRDWNRRKDALIASGCAPGTWLPQPVYNRCEPQIEAMNAELAQLNRDAVPITSEAEQIRQGHKTITEQTLSNTAQKKHNQARRDELQALEKQQRALIMLLKKTSEPCQEVLRDPSASCERIASACRAPWDTRSVNLPPSLLETGPCAPITGLDRAVSGSGTTDARDFWKGSEDLHRLYDDNEQRRVTLLNQLDSLEAEKPTPERNVRIAAVRNQADAAQFQCDYARAAAADRQRRTAPAASISGASTPLGVPRDLKTYDPKPPSLHIRPPPPPDVPPTFPPRCGRPLPNDECPPPSSVQRLPVRG
jgi:hypothetical protein